MHVIQFTQGHSGFSYNPSFSACFFSRNSVSVCFFSKANRAYVIQSKRKRCILIRGPNNEFHMTKARRYIQENWMNMDNYMTRGILLMPMLGAVFFLERYAAAVLADLHTTSQLNRGSGATTMHAPRTPDDQ